MTRRFSPSSWIIFGLIAVGILARFLSNPVAYLIPIIIFGGVFLLYKYPPGRPRPPRSGIYSFRVKPKPKKRYTHFRVIRGNKPGGDEPPNVH